MREVCLPASWNYDTSAGIARQLSEGHEDEWMTALVFLLGVLSADASAVTAPNFRLQDFRGDWHSLQDFQDKKAIVVVFTGVECPLAKLYAPRLVGLAKEYAPKGVAFLALDANEQDSITQMKNFA